MKIRLEDLEPKASKSNVKKVLENADGVYRAYYRLVAFQPGDPLALLIFKVFLRFVGIFIMILLSPFLLLALIIAFILAL
jgi:hypothetical protein